MELANFKFIEDYFRKCEMTNCKLFFHCVIKHTIKIVIVYVLRYSFTVIFRLIVWLKEYKGELN